MPVRVSVAHARKLGVVVKTPAKRGMNKLESRFAGQLEAWRHVFCPIGMPPFLVRLGALQSWQYEPLKLVLADKCTYKPDFLGAFAPLEHLSQNPSIVFFETKGFFRDDAKVKVKVAARQFPFWTFIVVTWKRGDWCFQEVRT